MHGIRTKVGIGVAAVAVAGMAWGAAPSKAAAGAATVVGHGTISPGLTNTPTFQSVTFVGTLVGGSSAKNAGTYNCVFNGSSNIAETLQKGHGTATGSCRGSKGTTTSNVTYTRTSSEVTLAGTASGSVAGHVTGACDFAPTSAPTVKSYQLQCAIALK
ncbi:MAG: hypothetical protein ACJ735_09320 [Actinomycetes bacterium]